MRLHSLVLVLLCYTTCPNAFRLAGGRGGCDPGTEPRCRCRLLNQFFDGAEQQTLSPSISQPNSASVFNVVLKTMLRGYDYDGWKLTYRYRPASKGYENNPNILLIHPVGIGLASWYWERLMNVSWQGPAMIAPNLIGCGISEGSAEWDPDKRGLFVPLDWVRSCEALIRHVQEQDGIFKESSTLSSFWQKPELVLKSVCNSKKIGSKKWVVVSQGGLAPIAVLLASRNPNLVGQVVLASPPPWKEMTTSIPEQVLARNYNFFKSPLGRLAFDILESRTAIALFSNLFLFSKPCDNDWLDLAEKEMGKQARSPVAVFNAGFTLNQSLEPELLSMSQRTVVVQGQDDHRDRREYLNRMKNCTIETAPGKNVIPWESPNEFLALISTFTVE